MKNFLSSIAIVLSLLASLFSGFTAYKVFTLEQKVRTLSNSVANQKTDQTSSTQAGTTENLPPQNAPSTPTNTNTTSIQPGQFVRFALKDKAQIELLKVKRIKDPDTGTNDVVNVQFRVRRLAKDRQSLGIIDSYNITARNPDTSKTYKSLGVDRSSGSIVSNSVKSGASVDAYVWLKVPDGVNTIDLDIPGLSGAEKSSPLQHLVMKSFRIF
jgi:hypothetical protein